MAARPLPLLLVLLAACGREPPAAAAGRSTPPSQPAPSTPLPTASASAPAAGQGVGGGGPLKLADGGLLAGTPHIDALVDVNGPASRDDIARILNQSSGRFRLCYEQALRHDTSLTGAVIVAFTIDAGGNVVDVKDAGSTISGPSVTACALRGVAGLSFAGSDAGATAVTYSMAFSVVP